MGGWCLWCVLCDDSFEGVSAIFRRQRLWVCGHREPLDPETSCLTVAPPRIAMEEASSRVLTPSLGVSEAFMFQYPDYTITWPDGTVSNADNNVHEWIIPEESELNNTTICVEVADPYGCDPQEVCGLVFIGDVPTWDPQPTYSGALSLCPEQPETLDLNANFTLTAMRTTLGPSHVPRLKAKTPWSRLNGRTSWTSWGTCSRSNLLGLHPHLTASIANPCLGLGLQHDYSVVVDNCEILPVNVFTLVTATTRTTPSSSWASSLGRTTKKACWCAFSTVGATWFTRTRGTETTSPWYGDDAADGVYFYTILLPNGDEKRAQSTFSVSAEEGTGGQSQNAIRLFGMRTCSSPMGGQCAQCKSWNTLEEESVGPVSQRAAVGTDGP